VEREKTDFNNAVFFTFCNPFFGNTMLQRLRKPAIALLVIALSTNILAPTVATAGTFNRTRTMDIKYAWGTSSMAEFDMYEQMYPGYFPIAEVTFQPDGTFDVTDLATGNTGNGVYDKRGKNLEITILNPQYIGVVQYVGRKVAPRTFEGDILVNGNPAGNWRGTF